MSNKSEMYFRLRNEACPAVDFWVFKSFYMRDTHRFHSLQNPAGITLRIVTKGTCTVKCGTFKGVAGYGDVFLAVPGVLIEFYSPEDEELNWIEFQVDGPKAIEYVHSCGLSASSPIAGIEDTEELIAAFKEMHEFTKAGTGSSLMLVSIALKIAALMSPEDDEVVEQTLTQKAISLLETMPTLNCNTSNLADQLNVGKSTLQRAFKKELNTTPKDFLHKLRITRAKELLRAGKQLAVIAHALGFSSDKYFMRFFKQETGTTPGNWRKNPRY